MKNVCFILILSVCFFAVVISLKSSLSASLEKEKSQVSIKLVKSHSKNHARSMKYLNEMQKALKLDNDMTYYLKKDDDNDFLSVKKQSDDIRKKKRFPLNLKNYKNTQYTANIAIGTPPQEIPVILDTGSGNVWVNSALCESDYCKKNEHFFDRKLSSTFQKEKDLTLEIEFASGKVSGEFNKDTFYLGDIKIEHQRFGEIIKEEGDVFNDTKFGGIIGLGFSSLTSFDTILPFDNIINNHLVDHNIMTFFYSLNEDTSAKVTIGYIDKSLYKGQLHYFKVIEQYYWTIALKDIQYNNKSLGLCDDGCKAAIDTGTTLITGPPNSVKKLLKESAIEDDCSGYDNFKSFTFVMEDINGETINFTLKNKNTLIDRALDSDTNKEKCTLKIGPIDIGEPHGPIWVIGDIFMQQFYTVFDRDQVAVGFARANHKEKVENY